MKINLHKNARTTPAQREFIQNETALNISQLASRIGVSETTVRKWKNRSSIFDKPHVPKKIISALTPVQELGAIFIRLCLRPGLDDLHQILKLLFLADCSRSSLNRLLRRYQISRLCPVQKNLPLDIKSWRGTYFFYTKMSLPMYSVKHSPITIHTLLDCNFRWCFAKILPAGEPSLPFIKKTIETYSFNVLGIIAQNPLQLTRPDKNFLTHQESHMTQVENYCRIREMSYHRIQNVPFDTIALLQKRGTHPDKSGSLSNSISGHLRNNLSVAGALAAYNKSLPQRTLGMRTPLQALMDHYKKFPGCFSRNPEQSFETSRAGKFERS